MNDNLQAILLFLYGLSCLGLLGWYMATDLERRKRVLGLVLMVAVTALCLQQVAQQGIQLGIDLKGGTSFLLQLTQRNADEKVQPKDVEQAIEQIRKRVDSMGGKEALIASTAENRIMVQIPGLDPANVNQAREQLEKVSRLEFRLVHPQSYALIPGIQSGQEITPAGYRIYNYTDTNEKGVVETTPMLVKIRPEMTGDTVKNAYVQYGTKGFEIGIEFNAKGREEFGRVTSENVGNLMAIMLDDKVASAPRINEPILQGRCSISGNFTEEQARSLASTLENPLQVKPTIQQQSSVSATLGTDSIRSGVLAAIAGLIGTLLFMALYYRSAGLVAVVGLLMNIALLFGAMAMFGFVLTLPGIAGIILAIGVAVDANVLVFERFREERALGKSLKPALEGAFNKAFSAIMDSNLTTLITTAILFWQATGPVKGFAVTLTIGVIASLFAALVGTHTLLNWMIFKGWVKELKMANFFGATTFDFLKYRRITLITSLVVALLTLGFAFTKGETVFGVDFRGGDSLSIQTNGQVTTEELRSALAESGFSGVTIQSEQDPTGREFKRVVSEFGTSGAISDAVRAEFPDRDLTIGEAEQIGPVVGRELARSSGVALALGLLGILIYTWFRFEFSFAIGAIGAVIHDVVLTVGILVLFGGELNLVIIGAVLTVAGYSINDTIVIFDRIREHLSKGSKQSIKDLMNESLNQTLQRTVLTGSTTLVPLVVLFLFGGSVLKDFAFTLILGIFVGTYSSVFIAAPIVLWWGRMTGKDLRDEVLATEEEAAKINKQAPLAPQS